MSRTWIPKSVKGKKIQLIADWLNSWGDRDIYSKSSINGKRTDFSEGYEQAIRDVIEKFGFKWVTLREISKRRKK